MILPKQHTEEVEKLVDKVVDDFLEDDYFNEMWEMQYSKLRNKLKSCISKALFNAEQRGRDEAVDYIEKQIQVRMTDKQIYMLMDSARLPKSDI